jgi:putative membrane protein (TIGR04086 family)
MRKSLSAVTSGILLALGIGALIVFGVAAPVFTRLFSLEAASTALPAVVVLFAAIFAFYFGGMFASYKAPNRRRLHGVAVGVASFAISPLINLGAFALSSGGSDPFGNLRTPGAALFTGVLFVGVLAASYVGARRGEALYAHNQAVVSRKRSRKAQRHLSESGE